MSADEKLATLAMTLKSDSGFRSQSKGDRISANQWRDIMLIIADAEAYRIMRAASDMLDALQALLAACEEDANATGGDFGPVIGPAAQKAEAALAKALPVTSREMNRG